MQETITDKQILNLFQTDAEKGFSQLVSKYKEKLYYHIRRIVILHEDADDALQNSFIKIWQNLPRFRGESSLYTWLYRISTNEALKIIRKKSEKSDLCFESIISSSDEGETWFDAEEAEKLLWQAIGRLPEKQRVVFLLKYYDELKYEDISKIMDTSVGALKASYHHAVKKIEKFISHH